ncbi:flavodoxin family protein [Altererythrobacter sp. SALINAS58]|uniref:flavodoxin family protein n=1 Tax=Alteripontixanthobacter muriae TaxID=2705546 RepID=UPI0015767653|nr:NAD(P)H-dependent oxidoreductase [Alteripontixanthobacter muriae]NTZ41581.1 flavodoxin family protein [Alteripontixanthobacter muriae]
MERAPDPKSEPHVLIAWHSRTGASEAMALAAIEGADRAEGHDPARLLPASQVTPADILAASAYIFVCPENLASISGMMKEMFDRCYYDVLGRIEGRAFCTIIAAGSDGEGAQAQIDRIAKGWRLKRVADPLIINMSAQTKEDILAPKVVPEEDLAQCRDLGHAMAEGVALGMF